MLKSWLRAANPFNAPRAMAEAERKARVATFCLLASCLVGLLVAVMMAMNPQWTETLMANQYARMGMDGQQVAAQQAFMSGFMPTMMLIGAIFTALISVGLAWAQWRYMTRAIPVILLAFLAYGALTGGIALATGQYAGVGPVYPLLVGLSWIVQCLCGVLYAASARGAWVLHRLKQEP